MGRGFRWFDDISASFRGMGDLPGFSPTLGWSRHWVPSQKSSVDVTKMLVAHPPVVQPCNLPIGHNGNIYQISYPFWLFHLQDPEGSLLRWSHGLSRASKKYFDLDDPPIFLNFAPCFEILRNFWNFVPCFEILPHFWNFVPFFEILPNFWNFVPFFKILQIFEILYPVLESREIFEILYPVLKSCEIFENLYPVLKFCEIFEI